MRLLLDEMWPPFVAEQLRLRRHDVQSVAAREELRTQPDFVIFARAQMEERAIVTEDARGFRRLAIEALSEGRSHAGLILTSPRSLPRSRPATYGQLVTALDALLTSGLDLAGKELWLQPI